MIQETPAGIGDNSRLYLIFSLKTSSLLSQYLTADPID